MDRRKRNPLSDLKAGVRLLETAAFFKNAAQDHIVSKYKKGDFIFRQGDDADALFYLEKGRVKVTVTSEQGKEAVIAIMGSDEFVGEGCLIGLQKRLATASAMTESAVIRVEKAAVMEMLRADPAFSQIFISHVLARNARLEEDLVDQLFNSTEKRLARLLLLLANFGEEGAPEPITKNISQQTMAEMIGTTRSRVSHFMAKFRKLGFINCDGHLEVHSSLLNVVLREQSRSVVPRP